MINIILILTIQQKVQLKIKYAPTIYSIHYTHDLEYFWNKFHLYIHFHWEDFRYNFRGSILYLGNVPSVSWIYSESVVNICLPWIEFLCRNLGDNSIFINFFYVAIRHHGIFIFRLTFITPTINPYPLTFRGIGFSITFDTCPDSSSSGYCIMYRVVPFSSHHLR